MRKEILELFEPRPWVRAIWEGGSAATGFLDEYSDLDLAMVVEDDLIEEAFLTFEGYLEEEYGIEYRMRLPEPTWHGHSQSFYFIGGCPPLFYIDFLVEKLSSGDRLLETDRHGNACIWLNRDGVLAPAPSRPDELEERRSGFLENIRVSFPLVVTEVRKQIARGKPIDSIAQHQRFVTGRLAGLLNLRYRPSRFDFGIRYAERAYPPEVNRRLEQLLYIRSSEDLEPAFERAVRWAAELLEELTLQQ
ncbi:MAG: nucleotidyltransferase domain-containing protein [Candidatus Fermentibacteraceae bacterium]|nr:nucleotidyltransferase domain-containing protein [Candidatus Fermentibacteraceae bacterium]MBN2608651.1 nucleotidyltransferase domain-containing protein [Candidatus Fermentibacteraceae bacterium]